MKSWTYSLIGLGFIATGAHAQQAAEQAAPSAAADASPYSEAEIDSFAKASIQINAINADAALDATQKQAQMAAAVKEAGLDPAKYNEIGTAAAGDAGLMAKVQTAMTRHSQPSEG